MTSNCFQDGSTKARSIPLRALAYFISVLAGLACISVPANAMTCLRGVNIAGAEFGGYQGEYGKKYIYPSEATLDWAAALKMTAIRLPFRWERVQPELYGNLDPLELARLQVTVEAANRRGLIVVLDVHNYAAYREDKIGTGAVTADAFADFWSRLAPFFSGNDKVVFGLMNEPAGVTAKTWFEAAQAGLNAIRATGSNQLILVPGTIWTGASHWFEHQEGGSNAELFQNITDRSNNFAFEFHQYLDKDFSGTNATCPRTDAAIEALEAVTVWLRENGFTGYLGEFGGTSSPDCLQGLEEMVAYVNSNNDTWIGWAAWAAGDWWGKYPLSLQPKDGAERPQLEVLSPYFGSHSGEPAACALTKPTLRD